MGYGKSNKYEESLWLSVYTFKEISNLYLKEPDFLKKNCKARRRKGVIKINRNKK